MLNTHTLCQYSRLRANVTLILAATMGLLLAPQVSASVSQSRLIVSATVVETCNVNLNPLLYAQQLQQLNKWRDVTKTSSCEPTRTAATTSTSGPQLSAEPVLRSLHNIQIDESAGQITLSF